MFIFDASVSFGLVWMAGEDSLIVLMVCFCSEYVFVIVHSDSCSLRKSGPFCYLLFMLIRLFYFILLINQLRSEFPSSTVPVFRVVSLLDLCSLHCGEGIDSIGFFLDHGVNDLRVSGVITFLE